MHCSAQEMQRDMPTAELSDEDFADGSVDILTLLHKSGLVASKSEARRAVQQGWSCR